MLDRVDELVDEQFAGEVHHLSFLLRPSILAYGLHQVRLAKADAAVNKERVVGPGRRLRDGQTGGMRNLIVRADYERFKGVSWIEPERARARFGVTR